MDNVDNVHDVDVVVESLRPGDEEATHQLNRLAFGRADTFDPATPIPPLDRIVGAYAGDRLVGKVVSLELGQWFGGRSVPMGGLSGVVCVPELRGRNLVRRMVRESFDRMLDAGEPVSALFPTTASLYRSVGYEIAGTWEWTELPLAELAALGAAVDGHDVVEVAVDDDRLPALYDAMAANEAGWLQRTPFFWRRTTWRLDPVRAPRAWSYLVTRDGVPVAHLVVEYEDAPGPGPALYRTRITDLAAVDGAALRAALGFCGRWGTTVERVRTLLPRHLLALEVGHAQRMTVVSSWPWMLRILDLPGAVAARGWNPAVNGEVPIAVADTVLARNRGNWVIRIADGAATAEPGGDGRVELDVTSLAAWYSGHTTAGRLTAAGRLHGATAADHAVLDAAVAGPPPTGVDFF